MKKRTVIIAGIVMLSAVSFATQDNGKEKAEEPKTEVAAEQIKEPEAKVKTDEEVKAEKEAKEKAKQEKLEKEKAAKEKKEAEAKAKKEKAEKEKAAKAKEQKEKEQAILQILKSSYDGMAKVEFNEKEKVFVLTPVGEAFEQELTMMIAGTKGMEDWDILKDSLRTLSSGARDQLGDGYSISLQNPMNEENSILMARNGMILYDAFLDMQ